MKAISKLKSINCELFLVHKITYYVMQAALAAYLDSCLRHGVEVPSGLHLLALDVALLTSHNHQVS